MVVVTKRQSYVRQRVNVRSDVSATRFRGENYGVEWSGKYVNGPFSAYGNVAWAVQRATNIVSTQQLFGADELAFIAHSWVFTDHAQTRTGSGGLAYVWNGTRINADMIYGSGLRSGDFNLITCRPTGRWHRHVT
jgi:hypothetical protein